MGHWLPLMVDTVAAPQASLTTRVNALVVLSAMLYAAGKPSAALPLSASLFYSAQLGINARSACSQHYAATRCVLRMTAWQATCPRHRS